MPQKHIDKQILGFLSTPPLWKNEQFGIQQFVFPELNLNEFESKDIPAKIRLGHQMEYVFKQLIEFSNDYEIVLHNLPVKNEKLTIGEIDFILKNIKTKALIHVELTYKFYIVNPDISEPIHRLMGPNNKDMFYTKMKKIKNQQFGLLHSLEGMQALNKIGLNADEIEHQTCYKGQLFMPFNAHSTSIRPLNKNCICGYWLPFEDFQTEEFKDYQFYIPSKSEWVNTPHNQVKWGSHFEILMDINLRMLQENTPMVWMRKSKTEFDKFFVVWW